MGDRIIANAETLMRQASMTAHEYFRQAVKRIDDDMGNGYAKEHPELIAAFMVVAADDFRTAMMTQAIQDGTETLANAIMNRE